MPLVALFNATMSSCLLVHRRLGSVEVRLGPIPSKALFADIQYAASSVSAFITQSVVALLPFSTPKALERTRAKNRDSVGLQMNQKNRSKDESKTGICNRGGISGNRIALHVVRGLFHSGLNIVHQKVTQHRLSHGVCCQGILKLLFCSYPSPQHGAT